MILGEIDLITHRADQLDGCDTRQPGHLAVGIFGGLIQTEEMGSQQVPQLTRGPDGNASSCLLGCFDSLVGHNLHRRVIGLFVRPHRFPLLQEGGNALLRIVCHHQAIQIPILKHM